MKITRRQLRKLIIETTTENKLAEVEAEVLKHFKIKTIDFKIDFGPLVLRAENIYQLILVKEKIVQEFLSKIMN